MTKTQPTMTWTYLQRAKKRHETTNRKQIFRLFYIMGQRVLFSNTISTQHLVAIIRALLHGKSWWKQSIKHLLSSVKRQLSCVFFTGYKFIFFCLGFVSVGKGRGYFFSSSPPLPCTSENRSVFNFYIYLWGLTMNEDFASGSRNHTTSFFFFLFFFLHLFIIKTSIRVKKGQGFWICFWTSASCH